MQQPAPQQNEMRLIKEISKITTELSQRIRILEEKLSSLEIHVSEIEKKLHEEIKENNKHKIRLSSALEDISKQLTNLDLNVQSLEKELHNYAKKVELKELKEYINLIKPINSIYVTKKELEVLVKNIIKQELNK